MSDAPEDWRTLDTFSFGDGPKLAEELAQLVLAGKKTATCWAAADGPLSHVGERMVMLDGAGRPRAILETVELSRHRYDQVDATFAYHEGEGDRTLEAWRRAHRNYFTRKGQFAADMELYCERFRVVSVIE